jgi:hypothetical protein
VNIDHTDPRTSVKDRRAVLIQAKLLKSGVISPGGKEWIQHELLAWRPGFDFVDPGYAAKTRDFNARPLVGNPANTAEYGGIDLKSAPVTWNQWLTSQTKPCFTSQADFGPFLSAMAVGRPQYGREAINGGSDDWSFTVDELLKVTSANPIVRQTPKVLRGSSAVAGFIVDTAPHLGGAGMGVPPEEGAGPDWAEGPMSTIRLAFSPQG